MRKSFSSIIQAIALNLLFIVNSGASSCPAWSFSDVAEKSIPSVVNISTIRNSSIKTQSFDSPYEIFRDLIEKEFGMSPDLNNEDAVSRKSASLGSGFIIDSKGYIVTNYHVIDKADEISITLSGNQDTAYIAKIVGKDPKTDLALLKIEPKQDLPFLKFGDSDESKVGDPVLVIGNPFGLGGSVSAGIISAKARNIKTGSFDDFIQTDAAINVGNSGGPLLNSNGDVIGVNSVILSPSNANIGIGFAIPSTMVKYVIGQLKENGKVTRGQLGVTIQDLSTDIAAGLGIKNVKGALVSSVLSGSPAEAAGIKVGDVITSFEGIAVTSNSHLIRMVSAVKIGKKVSLDVLRDGKTITLKAVIAKAKNDEEDEKAVSVKSKERQVFGMVLKDITEEVIAKYNLKVSNHKGAVVTSVEKGSIAGMAGIRPGDIITRINKKEVNSAQDFDNVSSNSSQSITLLVSRGGASIFISLLQRK